MSDIRNLHEKRASLLTEAQSIVTDLAAKGEALEGESQARFEKLTAEAATVAAAIRSEKEATEARTAADAARAEFAAVIAPAAKADADENAELRALARNGGTSRWLTALMLLPVSTIRSSIRISLRLSAQALEILFPFRVSQLLVLPVALPRRAQFRNLTGRFQSLTFHL